MIRLPRTETDGGWPERLCGADPSGLAKKVLSTETSERREHGETVATGYGYGE